MSISAPFCFVLLISTLAGAKCIPIQQVAEHLGDSVCVTGKVLQVSEGPSGTTFLNFCADYRTCPFTVVVFPRDLRHVGDVRQLTGKEIQIHGKIQAYDGRPEIVLSEARQLHGALRKLPPLPKEYDVARALQRRQVATSRLFAPARKADQRLGWRHSGGRTGGSGRGTGIGASRVSGFEFHSCHLKVRAHGFPKKLETGNLPLRA